MLNKAKKINEEIKKQEEVKEYLKLKEELSNNEDIKQLLNLISTTQKQMNEALKSNKMEEYKNKKAELEIYKDSFYKIPEINNYLILKENVYNLIEQISQIIGE